jgi:hypothetical protein
LRQPMACPVPCSSESPERGCNAQSCPAHAQLCSSMMVPGFPSVKQLTCRCTTMLSGKDGIANLVPTPSSLAALWHHDLFHDSWNAERWCTLYNLHSKRTSVTIRPQACHGRQGHHLEAKLPQRQSSDTPPHTLAAESRVCRIVWQLRDAAGESVLKCCSSLDSNECRIM